MSRKLFKLNGITYFSIVIKGIPKDMLLKVQKSLKGRMNSPGAMSTLVSKSSNCLKITYSTDNSSNRVSVVKCNLGWLMQHKQGVFYVEYTENRLDQIVTAFNLGDFSSAFTFYKKLDSVETYSVF